jgi:hypothetical protein
MHNGLGFRDGYCLCDVSVCAVGAEHNPSAAAMSAPPTTSFGAAIQAQNPLSPVYSLLNENSTNFNMGPLERTQDVLLVEPVIRSGLRRTSTW